MRVFLIITLLFFSLLGKVLAQKQVTHMVLFKLKPGVLKSDERYKNCLRQLKELPSKISEIQDWDSGENFSDRPVAYDVGLIAEFKSRKDLAKYLAHPDHVAAVNAWKEIADWNIVDFESD